MQTMKIAEASKALDRLCVLHFKFRPTSIMRTSRMLNCGCTKSHTFWIPESIRFCWAKLKTGTVEVLWNRLLFRIPMTPVIGLHYHFVSLHLCFFFLILLIFFPHSLILYFDAVESFCRWSFIQLIHSFIISHHCSKKNFDEFHFFFYHFFFQLHSSWCNLLHFDVISLLFFQHFLHGFYFLTWNWINPTDNFILFQSFVHRNSQ